MSRLRSVHLLQQQKQGRGFATCKPGLPKVPTQVLNSACAAAKVTMPLGLHLRRVLWPSTADSQHPALQRPDRWLLIAANGPAAPAGRPRGRQRWRGGIPPPRGRSRPVVTAAAGPAWRCRRSAVAASRRRPATRRVLRPAGGSRNMSQQPRRQHGAPPLVVYSPKRADRTSGEQVRTAAFTCRSSLIPTKHQHEFPSRQCNVVNH